MKIECLCDNCRRANVVKDALLQLRKLDRDFMQATIEKLDRLIERARYGPAYAEAIKQQREDYLVMLQAANAAHERTLDEVDCEELTQRLLKERAAMMIGGAES